MHHIVINLHSQSISVFRKMWYIFLLLWSCYHSSPVFAAEGMGSIGTAIQGFSPCPNGVMAMTREIGGPPKTENYWDGAVSLKDWPDIREVRLALTVDNPAKIEIDPNDARVLVNNKTFHMSFFEAPPKIQRVKFTVRGRPYGKFPNVVSLKLNDLEICPDVAAWSPSILGLSTGAETDANGDIDTPVVNDQELFPCGRRKIKHEGLITNGFETQPGDFPWHVAIFHRLRRASISYKCGGTIINPTTILTAGHCVFDSSGRKILGERVVVQLGRHQLYTPEANMQEFQVYQIKLHPEYQPSLLENDIAILKLANSISFTTFIQPICLWDRRQIPIRNVERKKGTVMGWGYTEKDEVSDVLKEATMPIVPFSECLQSNRQFFGAFLSDKNFCAGYRNGTSVCNGDSGGAMIFEENGVWRIRGVVSLSMKRDNKDLCNTSHYVIFTDVAQYLDWIESESA